MKLSELKQLLPGLSPVSILRPDGQPVPAHYHITEAGLTTKQFIDCGGTVRAEQVINLQVWVADDVDHRLEGDKLLGILAKFEALFGQHDLEIEVEYETDTIGKYGLAFAEGSFHLTPKHTDCLAKELCMPPVKKKLKLSELGPVRVVAVDNPNSCTPGSGCC